MTTNDTPTPALSLEQARGLLEKATPGNWTIYGPTHKGDFWLYAPRPPEPGEVFKEDEEFINLIAGTVGFNDALLIQAAPALARAYLAQSEQLAAALAELSRLRRAASQQQHEISNTLALALGYPRGPHEVICPTCRGGPCQTPDMCSGQAEWGEHVAETLAAEAVERIRGLEAELEAGRERERWASRLAGDMEAVGHQIQTDAEDLSVVVDDDEPALSRIIQNAKFLQSQASLARAALATADAGEPKRGEG